MTAEEMIVCDEKVDCCKDFTTKDIYDIVTGKEELEEIIEEGVDNEVIKISNKEASRAIDLLASLLLSNKYDLTFHILAYVELIFRVGQYFYDYRFTTFSFGINYT